MPGPRVDAADSVRQSAATIGSWPGNLTETQRRPAAGGARGTQLVLKVCICLAIPSAAAVLLATSTLQKGTGALLEWVAGHRAVGSLLLIFVYAVWTVLCLPGALITLGVGAALSPLWLAVVVVWSGAVVGQTVAFVLSRYVLRDFVAKRFARLPVWQALQEALEAHGWEILVLLRLAIVVPFDIVNYGCGLTPMHARTFVTASAVGIVPGVLLYSYLGSVMGDIGRILSGDTQLDPTVTYLSAAASLVLLVAAAGLLTAFTRRALQRLTDAEEEADVVETGGVPGTTPLLAEGRSVAGPRPIQRPHASAGSPATAASGVAE